MKNEKINQNLDSNRTLTASNEDELQFLLQAQSVYRETHQVARKSDPKTLIDDTELAVILKGNKLLRDLLENTVNKEIKKWSPRMQEFVRNARTNKNCVIRVLKKVVHTSIGIITLIRSFFVCVNKDFSAFLADIGLNIPSFTIEARKRMTHESAKQGFAAAAKALKRFHNINVSENTVRRVVEQEGRQIQEFLKKEKTATEDFRESDGVTETTVDGVMVNTYVEEKNADS